MTAVETPVETKLITGEEFAAMGDIGPAELVKGRIVYMSPTGDEHGGVELTVGVLLYEFVRQNKLGKVHSGEVGIYTGRNPDIVRGADVIFIANERYAQKTNATFLEIAPDLVVEVLLPSNTVLEMNQKLREYFAIGVRLVWLVDPVARSVLAYRALTDVREFATGDELPGDDVLPGFAVPVARIFED